MSSTAPRLDLAEPRRTARPRAARRCPTTSHCCPSSATSYPAVAYPAQQEEAGEEQLEETIYAGLVFP